jgi:PPOX class probable F420-dependent enzyme
MAPRFVGGRTLLERGSIARMGHQRMTDEEALAFLASPPARPAVVAMTRRDGRPHVAPIWYAFDDDGTIVFTTGEKTVKGRSLRRSRRAALCVQDDQPPFSFVTVDGTVTTSDNLDDVRHWARVIGGRYMGDNRAEEYGARNGVPGELVVRFTPEHIVAVRDIAD